MKVIKSSGNIFKDLGFNNHKEMLCCAKSLITLTKNNKDLKNIKFSNYLIIYKKRKNNNKVNN